MRQNSILLPVLFVLSLICNLVADASSNDIEIIEITIKNHEFVPAEVRALAGKKIKLVITNNDSELEEFESLVLCREKIIPPGKTVNVVLSPLDVGEYSFFGEFHKDTAKGNLIVE